MSMDFREGGGGGKSLHKMCDQLDTRGVPYVVRELKIADYIFFGEYNNFCVLVKPQERGQAFLMDSRPLLS